MRSRKNHRRQASGHRLQAAAKAPASPVSFVSDGAVRIEAAAGEGNAKKLPRFQMVAYTGGPMRVAGWFHPVVIDLAGLTIPSQSVPIRAGHDAAAGVGHSESVSIEGARLTAAGVISRDTEVAREIVASALNGFPWQASVGASVEEYEYVTDGQTVVVNGRKVKGPVNVIRKSTLGEISFVDLGADRRSRARVAASAGETNMTFEQWLIAKGFVRANLDETQLASLQAAYDAEVAAAGEDWKKKNAKDGKKAKVKASDADDDEGKEPSDPAPRTAAEQIRAEAAAESKRIADVHKACTGHPDIEARAIAEGWDATRAELEVLRADRPKAPAAHVPEQAADGAVLEAAAMLTGKLTGEKKVEQLYDAKTLEAASKRFPHGLGLQELLLEAAWANGYTGRSFRDTRAILRSAFGHDVVQAGFSTIDIGGILSNVANKFLLEGFFSVERVWRNICAIRNVQDFKTVTSYRLIGKDQYEIVAPGGELKHGTLGEEKYTNKADTYGLMLTIDRRDIINDDLGAITTVPRKLGRGSGLKINDVFWATFLNNAAFFTVGNKNYLVGADTALSVDGLTKAEVAFLDQTDGDGKPIGVMPQVLLVPTALSAMATMLFKSLEIRDNTGNKTYTTANPHQGKFRVEVSRYLSNGQYDGSSSKAWYLLADPNDLPVIEVAFLNGQESPTIETAEADFNVLGMKMRGFHDFGVSLQDPRSSVKAKGEA